MREHFVYIGSIRLSKHFPSFLSLLVRETLLGQLTSYLHSLRDTFTSLTSSSSQPHPSHSHVHRDPAQIAAAEKLAPPTGRNMPQVVNNVVWSRQMEAKVGVHLASSIHHLLCAWNNSFYRPLPTRQVADTLTTAEALLGDLAGFESFRNDVGRGLGEELREYQREQMDQWSRQTLAAIDHPSEPLR